MPRPAPTCRLYGRVRVKGTRGPLQDAEVLLFRRPRAAARARPRGAGAGKGGAPKGVPAARTFVDEAGRFSVQVPPGRYRVEVRAAGFFPYAVTERLSPGTRLEVAYYVERRSYDPYQTVVVARVERKEVTRHTVPVAVVEKIPGTQGDALRAVQNMPGVARAPFNLGFLIVRGAAPRDTRVFLEGHSIPHLYHFMGLSSVFNSDLLSRIDFVPGNFSVRYGRATGGIIDVRTRAPRHDRWHGYASADLWGVAALAEGPVGRGSLALTLRRSHIDAIFALLPDISLTAATYDYAVIYDTPLGGGRLRVIGFGADDRLKRRVQGSSRFETVHVSLFAKGLVLYDRRWDRTRLHASLAGGYARTETGANARAGAVQDTGRAALRAEVSHEVSKSLQVRLGMEGEVAQVKLSTAGNGLSLDLLQNQDVDADAYIESLVARSTDVLGALYVEATWRPHPRLALVPGLRVDAFRARGFEGVSFDPRLTVRVDLLPKKIALLAGVGLFHQEPTLEERTPLLGGSARLGFERALHTSLGVAWRLPAALSLEVTGFYKHLWNLVELSGGLTWRHDAAAREGQANLGTGRIYGGELLLQKKLGCQCPAFLHLERCFGWISYTLLRSERREAPGVPWRLFEDDQTHLLTFLVQGVWPGGWELGVRFRLASGSPADFYGGGVFDADAHTYVPARGTLHRGRLPVFHQLDIRLDKRFVFTRWMLSLYLDIQNVYSYQYSEFLQYNFDYSQRGVLKGLPIVPSLGLKGEF